ncbi:hypothetical protein Y032_1079g3559 [Ancylostoma ceylanicum]|uniref:Uncharacterized protein n=1 Tax=Ancylostoma ceylanicum TaxID=53326 RepID=A0A016W6U4_9BILA|nr:hypothetical protein Y032_1079g3559 [Ancylostoma ceylanicum]
MTLPPCDRYLPDFVSAGPFEHVVEEVPYPILAIYLQALPGALWKNSTIPLWKNATPPLKTRHFFCINLIIFLGILLTKAMRRFPFKVCLTNVEVAVPIAEVIVTIARSDLPVCKRINAQKLLEEIQNKYPCIFVDKLANRANVRGVRWRQRNTDELVATLVAQAVDPSLTDSSGALRTLMQFVETYPRVMIRGVVTFEVLDSLFAAIHFRCFPGIMVL